MKVLLVSDTFPPDVNGASYFTFRLARSLAKAGHDVHAAAPSTAWKNMEEERDGVHVHRIASLPVPLHTYFRYVPPPTAIKHMRLLVERLRPDVIHVQNHFLLGWAGIRVAKEFQIPLVATNHFMPENLVHYLHFPATMEKKVNAWSWKHFTSVFSDADVVTTPTKTAAKLLENIGFPKNVQTISCGIDLQKFHPSKRRPEIKQTYHLPENEPLILYVGRLEKEKHIEVLIQACARVRTETPMHLVCVGKGTEKETLVQLVHDLGLSEHVTFLEGIADDDVPAIYATADIFAIAGIAELQSIATMEALASGLPVVGANAMALPELVHDQENGFQFPPGDAEACAEGISKLLRDPKLRERMAQESLNIIQHHSIPATVEGYERAYTQAINAHRSV